MAQGGEDGVARTAREPGLATKSPVSVDRIDGVDALLALGESYDEFIGRAPDMSALFYSRGWIRRIRREFEHPERKPVFLLAHQSGRLIGLAPLAIQTKDWARGRIRRLYFYGHWDGALTSGMPGFVVPEAGQRSACVSAFLEFIVRAMRRDWDFLELDCFSQHANDLWLTLTHVPKATAVRDALVGHHADLGGDFDAYYRSIAGSLKKDLRRRKRRLEESDHEVRFGFTDRLSLEQLQQFAEVHHARQETLRARGLKRDSFFTDTRQTADTLRGLLDYTAREGFARHYYVEIDGRLAACELCFAHNGTLLEYVPAFDDRFGKYALPKLLQLFLFEKEASEFGTQKIDMMHGTNRIKAEFAPEITRYLNVRALNRDLPAAQLKSAWFSGTRHLVAQAERAKDHLHRRLRGPA